MSRRLLPLIFMTAVLAVSALLRTVRMHAARTRVNAGESTAGQVVGLPR